MCGRFAGTNLSCDFRRVSNEPIRVSSFKQCSQKTDTCVNIHQDIESTQQLHQSGTVRHNRLDVVERCNYRSVLVSMLWSGEENGERAFGKSKRRDEFLNYPIT